MLLNNFVSNFNKIRASIQPSVLTETQLELKEICEQSFYEFVKAGWKTLENREFIEGWHVKVMCEHLEAVFHGELRNLLLNLPPRTGKSNVISVFFVAWCWAKDPGLRFLYTSYAQTLSIRDSVACRRLITSKWFQSTWGDKFKLMSDVNNKLRFDNNKSGYRIASSVGGTNTGLGGDFVICDDPNNVKNVESETIRTGINEWWDYVMSTRVCNFKTARWIVAQQRTHSLDLSGHVLSKEGDGWVHLCLPMEFESANRCITIPLYDGEPKWRDPRKHNGELLWPKGIGATELAKLKSDFNHDSYRISGQLQQRPSPEGGGIIQKDWFQWWRQADYPSFEYILQSWDTALVKSASSCYSACTTWGVFEEKGIKNIMLLSIFSEKVEYPDLRKMAVRLYNNYEDTDIETPIGGTNRPDHILIEQKVSGYSLLQDLMATNIPVLKFNPQGSALGIGKGDAGKIGRCRLVTHLMENRLVWLPTIPPHCRFLNEDAQLFLQAASLFPNDESNDIIDSMSQAFIRLMQSGWISNKDDPREEEAVYKKKRPFY